MKEKKSLEPNSLFVLIFESSLLRSRLIWPTTVQDGHPIRQNNQQEQHVQDKKKRRVRIETSNDGAE